MALCRALPVLRRSFLPACSRFALISTTKKSKDTLVYPQDCFPKQPPPPPVTPEDFADVKSQKNWVSYGFDDESYERDRFIRKVVCFCFITVIFCGGTFAVAYLPDVGDYDWCTREAFLELHRRETLGLPLIDKNLIDSATIELPSDEELGDTEVVI